VWVCGGRGLGGGSGGGGVGVGGWGGEGVGCLLVCLLYTPTNPEIS